MARKLRTFTTSAGFFDLAVAAPSMKAAIEAWGADEDLFRNGFAKVSEDPKAVAATMKKPGVVLRRPVGSADAYGEDPALPESLPDSKSIRPAKHKARKRALPAVSTGARSDASGKRAAGAAGKTASRQAALAFEKEERRRRHKAKKEQRALETERQRRGRAVAALRGALDKASRRHDRKRAEIEKAQAVVDRRASAEKARWQKERRDLEAALRRARGDLHATIDEE